MSARSILVLLFVVSALSVFMPSARADLVALPYCTTLVPATSCPPISCAVVNGGELCTRDTNGDGIPEYVAFLAPGTPLSFTLSNQNGGSRLTYSGIAPTSLPNAPGGFTEAKLDAGASEFPVPPLPTGAPTIPALPSVSTSPPGVSGLPTVPSRPTLPQFEPRYVDGEAYAPHNEGATWRITFVDNNHDGTPERVDLWFFSPERGLTEESFGTGLP
ncbi:MAG: hypothetical protein ACYDCK_00515 [Thermoplasmatota archaeon]